MTRNNENILAKLWKFNAGYWFEKFVDNALIPMIYGIFYQAQKERINDKLTIAISTNQL